MEIQFLLSNVCFDAMFISLFLSLSLFLYSSVAATFARSFRACTLEATGTERPLILAR